MLLIEKEMTIIDTLSMETCNMKSPQTKFEQSFAKKYKAFWTMVVSWSRQVIAAKRVRPLEYPKLKAEYEAFKATIEPLLAAHDRGEISDETLRIIGDAFEYARRRGWSPIRPSAKQSGAARPTDDSQSREGVESHVSQHEAGI
jgi:hypothetical protein